MFLPPQPIELGVDEAGKSVFLTPKQRAFHTHIIGGIGKGKTTLMQRMVCQDIVRGHGVCLIDPHGGLYRNVLDWCIRSGYAKERRIHLINPRVRTHVAGFNPLWTPSNDLSDILDRVDSVLDAVSQVWGGEDVNRLPTFQRIFSALMFAIACKRLTLVEAPYLVPAERGLWREYLASDLPHPMMAAVWKDIQGFNDREHREQFTSVFNRLDPFLKLPVIGNMLGQQERTLDFQRCMDEGDVVLVNLQKAPGFSIRAATLLGRLLINNIYVTALGRVPERSRPFYLYVDECYRFLNDDIEGILSECRKYGLHLTLAHQHIEQLRSASDVVCSAVMNVAVNKIVFSLRMEDAKVLADDLFGELYDFEEPKQALMKPTVTGFERILLRNWMESHSHSEGFSESLSIGTALAHGAAAGDVFGTNTVTVFDANNNPLTVALGNSTANSRILSEMTSVQEGRSEARTSADTVARAAGWGEALAPILQMLPGGVYSLEEQRFKAALSLKRQTTGEAAVSLLGHTTKFITTKPTTDYRGDEEAFARAEERLLSESEYVTPTPDAVRLIRERQAALEAAVRAHAGHPFTGGKAIDLSPEDDALG